MFSTFSKPIFLGSSGRDPYCDPCKTPIEVASRRRRYGRQMSSQGSKKGKSPSSFIQKEYVPASVGEQYRSPPAQIFRVPDKKLAVATRPFLPSTPAKKTTGPGSRYTELSRFEHMTTTSPNATRGTPKQKYNHHEPKGFLTAPAKSQSLFQSSPTVEPIKDKARKYASSRYRPTTARLVQSYRIPRSGSGLFDPSGPYAPTVSPTAAPAKDPSSSPTRTPRRAKSTPRGSASMPRPNSAPFLPTTPRSRNMTRTFTPHPPYVSDDYASFERARSDIGRKPGGPTFHTTSAVHGGPSRSVIFH
ncbi:protein of unknown function DUF4586 [Kipferlia bialata]|uniref:Cilia-and flagella-associated protein 96 n=1 Tax=Kipferlia bialata TaxID=797122 RepID=A0A9K3GMR6_9EUKA|nr:protein of unknown function DUF4586 [Kipferlia bialata]GIQ87945.1 protein of unknown function DUF4586 [Kipferlia bialata]|eukprot:g5435.t1